MFEDALTDCNRSIKLIISICEKLKKAFNSSNGLALCLSSLRLSGAECLAIAVALFESSK